MHNLFLFFACKSVEYFFSENELLSSTVLKLESNIWVNPWIFEQILAVFAFTIAAKWRQVNLKLPDYSNVFYIESLIQTTPEYTFPENVAKIGRVVSEPEGE